MHILKLVLALAALPCACPATAQAGDSKADEQAVRAFKTELWPRSYREGDERLLEQLLAAEFQMIDQDGVISTRAEEIAYVASKQPDSPDRSFRFEIERLDLFENGTAIVSGTGYVSQPDGQNGLRAFRYRSSNVLIKREGRWQAISSHVSGVRPEAR